MRGYSRLDMTERTRIASWSQVGMPVREIARLLGRSPSTVSRELSWNGGAAGYDPARAHGLAGARAKRPGARALTGAIRAEAYANLAKGWSFAATCGRARREGRPHVSAETLYQDYYRRRRAGEAVPGLPRSGRRRRPRRSRALERRGRLRGRADISERPAGAGSREEVGHWEGDLVNGKHGTGHYVTLTDRATRFTKIKRIGSKDARTVLAALRGLLSGVPPVARRTLTLDNGKEFALHAGLAERCGVGVYFARPYHAWERGSNENRNRVLREVLPKGSDFREATRATEARIRRLLNDRPLACLGYETPREAFMRHLGAMKV